MDNAHRIMIQCDQNLANLKQSIDAKIFTLANLKKTLTSDSLGEFITLTIEIFSLLDTAQQYELFIQSFNQRITEKACTLATIKDKLVPQSLPGTPVPVNSTVLLAEQVAPTVFVPEVEEITEEVGPSAEVSPEVPEELQEEDEETPEGPVEAWTDPATPAPSPASDKPAEVFPVGTTFSGKSLTSMFNTTDLHKLVKKDSSLLNVPPRMAAISKLCELRYKAETCIAELSPREAKVCLQTTNVDLKKRLLAVK